VQPGCTVRTEPAALSSVTLQRAVITGRLIRLSSSSVRGCSKYRGYLNYSRDIPGTRSQEAVLSIDVEHVAAGISDALSDDRGKADAEVVGRG
jgi:hypothetical protein